MNTLGELQQTIGGTLQPDSGAECDPRATRLGRVVADSRQVEPGDVFWALVGPNHDGADFAGEAFARGAMGVVAARMVEAPSGRWVLTVDDAERALREWAKACRESFTGTVIAVTGSVGKTTTRQMIHSVLKTRLSGTASPKNYNNHVGVPLSVLRIEAQHDYAVLELGASARGEIAALAELSSPTIGVITNVGDAHLGGFGSRAGVAEAKAELVAALPTGGHAVLADHPMLRRLASRYGVPVTWIGRGGECDLAATDVRWSHGKLSFRVFGRKFCVPVWGRHHLDSALAAVAVGLMMGFDLGEIAAALEGFRPIAMRCEVTRAGGATIINDAYNASPTAMRAALELLRELRAPGRRIVVAGDMSELGHESAALHRRLGIQAVTICGADMLIACGGFAGHVVAGARTAGMPPARSFACATAEEAIPRLGETVRPGDVVLVKGSRTMGMERVVEAIRRHPTLKAA